MRINKKLFSILYLSFLFICVVTLASCDKKEKDDKYKNLVPTNMALGEGTGTCISMAAAKCALSVYEGGTHFEDINVNKYERFV